MSLSTTFLNIRSFNSISFDHVIYVVPAYTEVAVCETRAMQVLKGVLGLRRKTIERLRLAQSPGEIFQIRAREGAILTALLLADNYESVSFSLLCSMVEKTIIQNPLLRASCYDEMCFIGDGFRAGSNASDRSEVEIGFEMLCRALRRAGFRGVVYEPPEMQNYPSTTSQLPLGVNCTTSSIEDERITGTHPIVDPDGNISPSIPPTLLKSLKKRM